MYSSHQKWSQLPPTPYPLTHKKTLSFPLGKLKCYRAPLQQLFAFSRFLIVRLLERGCLPWLFKCLQFKGIIYINVCECCCFSLCLCCKGITSTLREVDTSLISPSKEPEEFSISAGSFR